MPPKKASRARKRPRQERSRLTVEAILDAAVQVFARRGYAAGTTTRIADRAGVSVGSLYQYFPDKDAILVALAERHIQQSHDMVSAVLDEVSEAMPLREVVWRLVDAMVAFHVHEPDLHRVLFDESPRKAPVEQFKGAREGELLARLVTLLRDHPEVAVANPTLAAALMARTVEAHTHHYVLDHTPPVDRATFTDELVRMLTSYLRAPPS